MDWKAAYEDVLRSLSDHVSAARPVVCLTSACVDSRLRLADISSPPEEGTRADDLFKELVQRARAGLGGEIVRDWRDGPAWLEGHFPIQHAWGGTGPHAAMALTAIGAPTLTALGDRSEKMMSVVPGDVPLASEIGALPARRVTPAGGGKPSIYIIEYTAGEPTAGVVPPRSSRIILRFDDLGFEFDPYFDRLSSDAAFGAGAGLIAGFQCVPSAQLVAEYKRVQDLAAGWRRAGVKIVHWELAGFETEDQCHAALDAMSGHVTSIGMSLSEYRRYFSDDFSGTSLIEHAVDLRVSRICVHADEWVATATRGDPEQERLALMTGSLLAATRASAGKATRPTSLPDGYLGPSPFDHPQQTKPGWSLVSCPTLYLPTPTTTLGMGDTFTGGCLMILSQHRS